LPKSPHGPFAGGEALVVRRGGEIVYRSDRHWASAAEKRRRPIGNVAVGRVKMVGNGRQVDGEGRAAVFELADDLLAGVVGIDGAG
jgi:hypothetical protein